NRSGRLLIEARAEGKARARTATRRTYFSEPTAESRGIRSHRAQARTDLRAARRAVAPHSRTRHLLLSRRPEVRDRQAQGRRELDRRIAEVPSRRILARLHSDPS